MLGGVSIPARRALAASDQAATVAGSTTRRANGGFLAGVAWTVAGTKGRLNRANGGAAGATVTGRLTLP